MKSAEKAPKNALKSAEKSAKAKTPYRIYDILWKLFRKTWGKMKKYVDNGKRKWYTTFRTDSSKEN